MATYLKVSHKLRSKLHARRKIHDDATLDISVVEWWNVELSKVAAEMRAKGSSEEEINDAVEVVQALAVASASASGGDPEELSCTPDWNSFYDADETDVIVQDGYCVALDNITRDAELCVGTDVILEREVTRVRYQTEDKASDISAASNPRVVVSCRDGSRYSCDHLVVTLPIGVLKAHHEVMFDPPLPPRIRTAVEGLGAGLLDKIVLKFETAWWSSEIDFTSMFSPVFPPTIAPTRGMFKPHSLNPLYAVNLHRQTGAPILVVLCYRGWAEAAEAAAEKDVVRLVMDVLRKGMNIAQDVTVPEPLDVKVSAVSAEPPISLS
ncbi:Lysine-specific histone demethylase 1A [Gonapodya sp. JEL0774]|nr:Lysine-specific histone demethylase 1A [Gonapodya sp. JEL0774]